MRAVMDPQESSPVPGYIQLELNTAYGPVYRKVSTLPARNCTSDEIPVLDFSTIYDDTDARRKLAESVKVAAESSGFFYIKNHGIPDAVIQNAQTSALR
jgi:hypothetical protein